MKWICLVGGAVALNSSPVRKVVQLLGDMESKIKKDLAKEEEQMAAYSQWCKDEPAARRFQIKEAQREIDHLNGVIEGAKSKISTMAADIQKLSAEVAQNEQEVEEGSANRAEENKLHLATEKELRDTIDMVARAVSLLKRQVSFAQGDAQASKSVKELTEVLKLLIDSASTQGNDKRKIQAFMSVGDDDLELPQATVKNYETHGGTHAIIETLEDMKDKAESQLNAERTAEMNSAHEWEMMKQSLSDEIKFKNEKIQGSQSISQEAAQEQAQAEGDLAATTKDKEADEGFLAEAVPACQNKASEWAQRKKNAGDEMKALSEAIDFLKAKFAFPQLKVVRRHLLAESDDDRSNAVRLLKGLSRKYGSFGLMQIANAASKGDPFAKVRGLIMNMIAKLQQQGIDEANHESYCKEETAKSSASRDKKTHSLDMHQSRIDKADAGIAKLKAEVSELQTELADITKTNGEMTAQRTAEKETFVEKEKDLKEAVEAVSNALNSLKQFYGGSSFVQQPTVELGSTKTDSGNVVIGILEQAESDFSKDLALAREEESNSEEAYEKTMQANKVAQASKSASLSGKESEIVSLQGALERHKADHSTVSRELEAILDYLAKLSDQCTSKAQTYGERAKKREEEISGLKEALKILEGESSSFVQKQTLLSRKRV